MFFAPRFLLNFTGRELEVFRLIAKGVINREITAQFAAREREGPSP